MEARERPGRSGGEIGPALAKARRFIGGALICGTLAAGFQAGLGNGCSPWVEPIRDKLGDTLAYRSGRRKIEKAQKRLATAISDVIDADSTMAEAEAGMLTHRYEMASIRAESESYSNLRDMYRGGWIDPKCRALDRVASRIAIWQRNIHGTIGYGSSTLGFLFAFSSTLDPACAHLSSRRIDAIIRSGMADGEEKARVLASLVLAAGGSAYLADDNSFLYALAKKNATPDDIREIEKGLGALASAYGAGGQRIHGRLFGKDYYVYCDPACQPSAGLGAPPHDPMVRMLLLKSLDY